MSNDTIISDADLSASAPSQDFAVKHECSRLEFAYEHYHDKAIVKFVIYCTVSELANILARFRHLKARKSKVDLFRHYYVDTSVVVYNAREHYWSLGSRGVC